MKPVKQKFLHKPEDGIYGDCYRAAIASLLEYDIEDVPHFYDGDPSDEVARERIDKWSRAEGVIPFHFSLADDPREFMADWNFDAYYLLTGKSKTGVNHTVICMNDSIVHDPSLANAGIVGPAEDKVGKAWIVEVFAVDAHRAPYWMHR